MAAHNVGGNRAVIVLGKTGCGKSTLANKIVCDDPFLVARSFSKCTASTQHVEGTIQVDGKSYTINMIDTIGFCDTGTDDSGPRSDSDIMKEVKRQLQWRAPNGLSLIIFVLRYGRFTQEEYLVFKKITKHFRDMIKKFSLLVITGCDGLNETARDKIVAEFRSNPKSKPFADIMEKGIYCVGLPDIDGLQENMKQKAIEESKKDMIPIHKTIAEAHLFYIQEEIQRNRCVIL